MTIRAEALFCDDVRTEANGKNMFIGVYRGYMGLVGGSKQIVPKLTAVLLIDYSRDLAGHAAQLRLMNGDHALIEVQMNLPLVPTANPVSRPDDGLSATIPVELIPFQPEDGMRLRLEFDCSDFHYRSSDLEIRIAAQDNKAV